jgi:hypothetical protein
MGIGVSSWGSSAHGLVFKGLKPAGGLCEWAWEPQWFVHVHWSSLDLCLAGEWGCPRERTCGSSRSLPPRLSWIVWYDVLPVD